MDRQTDQELTALADAAERGELRIKPGTIRRGEETRREARRRLMEATETSSLEDAVAAALGRSRLGSGTGPSPVMRVRVPGERQRP